MPMEAEAVYEDGVLKLERPLPLDEHERVTVRIQPQVSRIRKSAGLIPLPEGAEARDYLLGPDNHPWEQQ
ncbi:MAG: antitoxin family protein [Thermoguttaceae bacterium]